MIWKFEPQIQDELKVELYIQIVWGFKWHTADASPVDRRSREQAILRGKWASRATGARPVVRDMSTWRCGVHNSVNAIASTITLSGRISAEFRLSYLNESESIVGVPISARSTRKYGIPGAWCMDRRFSISWRKHFCNKCENREPI